HLKLCDFGLCRTVEDPQGEIMTDCGKPWIRAPEMYLDKPCSFGIDWWSVGILLYRFITGCNPFITDKLTQGYQSVTKLKEKYPEWLFTDKDAMDLCQKLLIKDPKRRLCAENEILDIKSHPYFTNIDWDEEENMAHAIEQDMLRDVERYVVVFARMYTVLGLNTETLAASLSKARGNPITMKRQNRPSGYQQRQVKKGKDAALNAMKGSLLKWTQKPETVKSFDCIDAEGTSHEQQFESH
ncbi:protein kinase C, partial [Bulinus truncatus]